MYHKNNTRSTNILHEMSNPSKRRKKSLKSDHDAVLRGIAAMERFNREQEHAERERSEAARIAHYRDLKAQQLSTDLQFALLTRDDAYSQRLIESGADVNTVIADGDRPVHVAAYLGLTGTMRFLISKGVNVNVLSIKGQTPADIAHIARHTECLNLLLEAGAEFKQIHPVVEPPPPAYTMLTENEAVSKKTAPRDAPPKEEAPLSKDASECPVCYELKDCEILAPCGHLLCNSCIKRLNHRICPKCKDKIESTVKKVYRD